MGILRMRMNLEAAFKAVRKFLVQHVASRANSRRTLKKRHQGQARWKWSAETVVWFYTMSADTVTFDSVKAVILSAHEETTTEEKVNFYNSWAHSYEQDVAVLDYLAPGLAANMISTHVTGDRGAMSVLDVACGTGLAAKLMKNDGFGQFVGVDGSEAMLERARQSGLYLDLKQSLLGDQPLPFQMDSFDVVVISGALSTGQVPVTVVRHLCKCAKPGGYICMTTRSNHCNQEYKSTLELELRKMEDERLWSRVEVMEVEKWERAVLEQDDEEYIPGVVYLYQKLPINVD
ncbi:methyltransferase 27 isoform X1 [Solea senegalensis]|uniref:Methyltransferase 27 isoform X1 n=1 Tax=Solea senegalensis TaxID=28829 RepID=A0AAV6SHP8_SOLSE|nr:methyltransferase-like protein 27 [Solea senegalensis]KAG7516574.1 methyltransferase 27 isoform X1 [Solea senegalensis]